eukprot:scaffold9657_cov103-Isochrysis_galbana.AAC.2
MSRTWEGWGGGWAGPSSGGCSGGVWGGPFGGWGQRVDGTYNRMGELGGGGGENVKAGRNERTGP